MMKLLSKIQMHEAQKTLLLETLNTKTLLESKVISSLQPSVDRTFLYQNLENSNTNILMNTRRRLIQLVIKEKNLELERFNTEFNTKKQSFYL